MNRTFPQPAITYVSYRRQPDKSFHPPFEQMISLPQEEIHLRILREYFHESDDVIEIIDGATPITLDQHLLRLERFLHNELSIPYKVLKEITLL